MRISHFDTNITNINRFDKSDTNTSLLKTDVYMGTYAKQLSFTAKPNTSGCREITSSVMRELAIKIRSVYTKIIGKGNRLAHGESKTLGQVKALTQKDITPVIPNTSNTSYKFPNSQLLEDFTPLLNETVLKTGISAKNQRDCFLRASSDIPLGTSGVGNCAVICMQNSRTGTHALYHAFPYKRDAVETMQNDIYKIMPEGFDKVYVIPGRDPETAKTSTNLLKAACNINKNAQVEFRHFANGDNAQIILYKGNVYSLPIKDNVPTFKVCENLENYFY